MLTSEWVLSDKHAMGRKMAVEGIELMAKGVGHTIRREVESGVFMGVVGGTWGGIKGLFVGDIPGHIIKEATQFAKVGAIYGWFAASADYSDAQKTHDVPKVGIIDWAMAVLASWSAYNKIFPFHKSKDMTRLLITQFANPMTTAGTRRLLGGLEKMAIS